MCLQWVGKVNKDKQDIKNFPLAPMGVLAHGSAHASPSVHMSWGRAQFLIFSPFRAILSTFQGPCKISEP